MKSQNKTTVTYDTITIKTQNYNPDKISAVIETCEDAAVKHRKDGSWLKTGSHNHVRIFLTEGSLAINFNPNKMIHGNNEINTTIDTYILAMFYLESWLNLHLHDATVSRVDAGINIFMVKEPSKYIELLAYCSKAMKVTYAKETLTFTNGIKDTVFYDKGLQMDKMKLPRQASQQGKNLLRIEVRCKKPKLALNVPQLTAGMLMDEDIINKIVQLWQRSYLNIHKVVRPQAEVDCSDTKNFIISLANHGVEALGIDAVLNHIDSVSDNLSVVQRHRLRKKLFKITSSHTEGSTQILLDELSEKIQWIAANAA